MSHICLLGLMGSGKSTVGERLAYALRRPFVDLDALIVAKHGPIKELFLTLGEQGFRCLESEALSEACKGPTKVISPGGGAVTHETTRLQLAQMVQIYLEVPLPVLMHRLRHSGTFRPLLGAYPSSERVEELWHERHQWYEEANIRVNGDAPVEWVVAEILKRLEKR